MVRLQSVGAHQESSTRTGILHSSLQAPFVGLDQETVASGPPIFSGVSCNVDGHYDYIECTEIEGENWPKRTYAASKYCQDFLQ